MPEGFLVGTRLAETGNGVSEHSPGGQLTFDSPLEESSQRFVFETDREAPLVGAHLLTATPLSDSLPPIALRLATTRGTNALLEGRGADLALFINEGFGDLMRIGDQTRPDLFALEIIRPEPLHAAVVEVLGRLGKDGNELEAIDEAAALAAGKRLLDAGIRTACVALLHSYRNPQGEQRLAEALRRIGFHMVITSSEVSRRIHFGRRTETALIDTYLAPLMEAYLTDVEVGLSAESPLRIMTSAGGLVSRERFRPIDSLLSGPAGGVVGAAAVGRRLGRDKVIAFDMGGTSTDVSRYDGHYHYQRELTVGPARLQREALRIETVAAGGGSLCLIDQGALKVGPESAGASPGPACYGEGGPLTITDVHVLLGRLVPDQFAIPLDVSAAKVRWADFRSEHRIAADQGEVYLEGFLQIANERMTDAIRTISLREGADPSDYALLAFGGAGGLHACALAELLGIEEVLVPRDAGILSARGLEQANLESQRERQVLALWEDVRTSIGGWIDDMREAALAEIGLAEGGCDITVEGEWRFEGQESTLALLLSDDPVGAFHEEHARIYGHVPERPLELESLRVRVCERGPALSDEVFASPESVPKAGDRRRVWSQGAWRDVPCYASESLPPSGVFAGPLMITDPHCTIVVEAGWTAQRGSKGTLALRRCEPITNGDAEHPQEVLLELFTQRFRNVVNVMGEQLRKTALSTNVKERFDYSCCLLDAQGRLVANAPHIPVHLGAMGLCVRRVMETLAAREGDVILTNHPAYGGSHLPDLTVIMPVFYEGDLTGFVANRAHHAEMGGIRPGSMPPNATSLEEEGVIIPPIYLFAQGESCEEAVRAYLLSGRYPTRAVDENLADLRAQVASCRAGGALFVKLLATHGEGIVEDQLNQLYESAAKFSGEALTQQLASPVNVREVLDDGSEIHIQLGCSGDRFAINFEGTSLRHPANLHATPAIVRSALIYVIRLLQARDLPLNEGLLAKVDVLLPTCFLNPDFDAEPLPPVVGGNVETSQRLVEALLQAFDLVAGSQGTMNNLIFGNHDVSYYETVCGGAGAGPGFAGASGVHTHMTNTAITDPEILEWRYPVRLHRFALRHGSGGKGEWPGGDGVVRELEFLVPLAVSLLTQHRAHGPRGRAGGQPGASGCQTLIRKGESSELGALASVDVEPGDRLILETPGGGGWGT